jgi:N-methylhydantoinase B
MQKKMLTEILSLQKINKMDKFTIDIIQNSLIATGEEMFVAMQQTSMSPILYEALDYAVGITDANGELLAQGNGITAFLACLDSVVKSTIDKFGIGNLHPGDVVISNTPYAGGGTHLSDVSIVMPVYYNDKLVAFTVNKAHWTELGGAFPGSVSTVATEIYQEGLHFPFVKLKNRGEINEAIVDILRINVRLPESTLGDMYAGIAACEVGSKRLLDLFNKYGEENLLFAVTDLLNYGEVMCRQELKNLPQGVFEGVSAIESDGLGGGPFPIQLKVTIKDGELIADFNGSHPQVRGAVNLSFTGLDTGCRSVFKAITTPDLPANGGSFRPLTVLCEQGTILSAQAPAAMSIYYEALLTAMDLFWKVMAPVVPHRLPAGHLRSVCATFISGIHPESKQFFIMAEPLAGGWGAGKNFDGDAGQLSAGSGESFNIPIELTEMRYGIKVNQYSIHNDGGGYGQFRGGNGLYLDYEITADEAFVTAAFLGSTTPTWGMKGGKEGSYNYFQVLRNDGSIEKHNMATNLRLEKKEVVRLVTATGGGYGDPKLRPSEAVFDDIKNGYITTEQASEFYNL